MNSICHVMSPVDLLTIGCCVLQPMICPVSGNSGITCSTKLARVQCSPAKPNWPKGTYCQYWSCFYNKCIAHEHCSWRKRKMFDLMSPFFAALHTSIYHHGMHQETRLKIRVMISAVSINCLIVQACSWSTSKLYMSQQAFTMLETACQENWESETDAVTSGTCVSGTRIDTRG